MPLLIFRLFTSVPFCPLSSAIVYGELGVQLTLSAPWLSTLVAVDGVVPKFTSVGAVVLISHAAVMVMRTLKVVVAVAAWAAPEAMPTPTSTAVASRRNFMANLQRRVSVGCKDRGRKAVTRVNSNARCRNDLAMPIRCSDMSRMLDMLVGSTRLGVKRA